MSFIEGCTCNEPSTYDRSIHKQLDKTIFHHRDWVFHKEYCGKQAYVFSVELIGSSNPTISRTVVVPSWFTFQQLHFTLQYIFGPWQNHHEHSFAFVPNPRPGAQLFFGSILSVVPPGCGEEGKNEHEVKLTDVYDAEGALRPAVTQDGDVVPLIYEYDFGDGWEHKITFEGSEKARKARPLVKHAVGCGPLEDCGGIKGWNDLKEAFSATSPTQEQQSQVAWAKTRSGLDDEYDPLASVDITPLNCEGRWKNHYQSYVKDEKYRFDY